LQSWQARNLCSRRGGLMPNTSFERTREDKVPSSGHGVRAAQLNL
jgi:hypothetical protein